MQFIKFPSLENTYKESFINRAHNLGITGADTQWMVTEKIHGANFGMYSDGENFAFASRTKIIEDGDESLFDGRRVAMEHKDKINEFAKTWIDTLVAFIESKTGEMLVGTPYIIVFGELYGGSVQKNMPYQKEQKFAAFDFITVMDDVNIENIAGVFSPINDLVSGYTEYEGKVLLSSSNKYSFGYQLKEIGIDYAPVLHVGTFEECLAYSNDFESTLTDNDFVDSLLLGEADRELRCKAEGVVIEPVEGMFYQQKRIYFKNRSPKFEEKKREPRPDRKQVFLDSISAKGHFVLERVLDEVTEDRYESARSKLGEVTIRDIQAVAGEMVSDIFTDFAKAELSNPENPDVYMEVKEYLEQEYKPVQKHLFAETCKFIKPFLMVL